jgi:hypothetical protein
MPDLPGRPVPGCPDVPDSECPVAPTELNGRPRARADLDARYRVGRRLRYPPAPDTGLPGLPGPDCPETGLTGRSRYPTDLDARYRVARTCPITNAPSPRRTPLTWMPDSGFPGRSDIRPDARIPDRTPGYRAGRRIANDLEAPISGYPPCIRHRMTECPDGDRSTLRQSPFPNWSGSMVHEILGNRGASSFGVAGGVPGSHGPPGDQYTSQWLRFR